MILSALVRSACHPLNVIENLGILNAQMELLLSAITACCTVGPHEKITLPTKTSPFRVGQENSDLQY